MMNLDHVTCLQCFAILKRGLERTIMSKFMSQHYIYTSIVRNTPSTSFVKHNHLLVLVRHFSAH